MKREKGGEITDTADTSKTQRRDTATSSTESRPAECAVGLNTGAASLFKVLVLHPILAQFAVLNESSQTSEMKKICHVVCDVSWRFQLQV